MKSSVLISSAGSKVPLIEAVRDAVARTVGISHVVCADTDPKAICQFFSDEFWCMKPLNFYDDTELIKELHARSIVFIIPTRDGELKRWAALKQRLMSEGIEVLVSDLGTLNLTMDKLLFSKWLQNNGFEFIKTWEDADQHETEAIVVKERFSDAPKNTVINVSKSEANILSSQLKFPIFQEFIEGQEISVDVWMHRSMHTTLQARTRDLIIDGEARVTSQYLNTQLEMMVRSLVSELGVYGPSVFQFIVSPDGKFYPIECNARVGGASTFSIRTKFDSIYVALSEFLNEPTTNLVHPNSQTKQVRAMKDFYF